MASSQRGRGIQYDLIRLSITSFLVWKGRKKRFDDMGGERERGLEEKKEGKKEVRVGCECQHKKK